ncbi:MAG: MFS transporter [Planctomycetaceae bacterium]|nr:MFS transporter [Planctomycetales bacterium]MCB9937095.1 MFS transporter [Planctomycetaceae bacterium]
MEIRNKATSIDLFSLKTRQMRAFHMSWFAFFLCFFAWFGIAPLMAVVREELSLTKEQIGNTIIASVAITILARLFIGWLCDRIGPRLCYTILLVFASIPVMSIGLATSYESFMLFRLGIGVIGASFVITQYHTSVMFAPNCVGTANATSAGWGNLGGGVTQMVMPLVFAGFIALGFTDAMSWRLSMVSAGAVCMLTGVAYFFFTTDLPDGNFAELREKGEHVSVAKGKGSFLLAAKDYRVWALFFIYASCFGIELTINNIAAIYYMDYFDLGLKTAGLVAGLFGLMNIFARTTGGFISDKFVEKSGLKGRVRWLFIALFIEGIALLFFSQMRVLALAIPAMIVFSLFVQMSEGATYSVVPFINKRALGSVSGIVGAGGNMGAVAAGFLFRYESITYPQALLILGGLVTAFSFFTFLVRFSPADEKLAAEELAQAHEKRRAERKVRRPWPELVPGLQHLRPMDALRMYLGIALMVKGIYFIMNMAELEGRLGSDFGEVQTLISWGVVFAHVVGGASLALGFVTRVSAGVNAAVLFGAVIITVIGTGGAGGLFGNVDFQFTSFVFVTLVLLAWRGAGPLSLDYLFRTENDSNLTPA